MKIGRYAIEPPKYQPHAIAHGRAPISSAYRGEADMNRRQEPTESVENDPSRKSSTPFAVTYEAATLPSGRAKLLSSG
jgi:hypothetical protein